MSYAIRLVVGLSLLLVGCGDRKVASETCTDMGVWRQLSPELNSECKGNSGCKVQPTRCGCHCAVCENEQCVSSICDDSCMPTCPATRPVPGSSCTVSRSDCDYTIEQCPCGPSDIKWRCSCVANAWSCAREYDCYPCMDGRRDAGPDARRDVSPPADVLKKDHAVNKDALKLDAGKCQVPSYPADCSQVSHFDCGFSAMCTGNVVKATWHEHVFCGDGMEQIYSFSCSTTCAGNCVAASAWPQNGTELVQQYCQ